MTFTPTPGVEISKTASETVAKTGDVITYTLTLVVTGSTASNVVVTDPMPDHLNYVGAGTVPAGGNANWDSASKTLTWTWTTLAPGTYTLTYEGSVDGYVQEGTILLNKASLTYNGYTGTKEASVSVTMATIYTVHVGVYNEAGELVKEIWVQQLSEQIKDFDIFDNPTITSLNGVVYVEVKGVKIATWDGRNKAGDPVTNGKYYVKVDNVDSFGVVNSVAKMVMVSRSIAKIQVNIYNEAGEIVRHLYAWTDDPGNQSLLDVQLSTSAIRPTVDGSIPSGTTGSVNITMVGGQVVTWDGKSDTGAIVSNGHYEVEVHFTDGKGNEQVISHGIVVQSSNDPLSTGTVYARPNILKDGVTTTTIMVNSSIPFTLTARLYDVAGELLWARTGPAGTNQVDLDLSSLASGLYFAVTDLTGAQGGLAGKQTTQIILQK